MTISQVTTIWKIRTLFIKLYCQQYGWDTCWERSWLAFGCFFLIYVTSSQSAVAIFSQYNVKLKVYSVFKVPRLQRYMQWRVIRISKFRTCRKRSHPVFVSLYKYLVWYAPLFRWYQYFRTKYKLGTCFTYLFTLISKWNFTTTIKLAISTTVIWLSTRFSICFTFRPVNSKQLSK